MPCARHRDFATFSKPCIALVNSIGYITVSTRRTARPSIKPMVGFLGICSVREKERREEPVSEESFDSVGQKEEKNRMVLNLH